MISVQNRHVAASNEARMSGTRAQVAGKRVLVFHAHCTFGVDVVVGGSPQNSEHSMRVRGVQQSETRVISVPSPHVPA